MNLTAILADCYRRLNFASTPNSAITTRLQAYVNEGLQECYSQPGLATWITRHQPALTFASVASTPIYTLPPGVSRIEGIRETTNDRKLYMMPRHQYFTLQPDPTAITGISEAWVPMGFSAVVSQPSDASQLLVKSSSASDTTQTAYLEGTITGGYPFTASVTLTGTTGVNLGGTTVIQVTKFYLSAVAVGTVTLHEDSAGVGAPNIALISIGETFARFEQIALWPTPSSAITYTVDAERDTPDMSNGTDEPMFPRRFHRILVDYALWKEYEKTDDSRARTSAERYIKGLGDLRYFLNCPPDYLPVLGRWDGPKRSRLGAWTAGE